MARWMLQIRMVSGEYAVTKWNTQEGAIADRERLLKTKPIAWTAIRKEQSR